MNYSMGSGIIRYIRASKTFSKFRAFRSSVHFEVPCASKFHVGTIKFIVAFLYHIYENYKIMFECMTYLLSFI